ncbi:MAG: hypothetical protein J7K23_09015 [Thermoproteales archaeon]|nr:hypothetical protein [Thermoproteales archaeon]
MVEFCPKCGSILVPVRKKEGLFLVCKKCGYEKKASKSAGYKKKEKISENKKNKLVIITSSSITSKEKLQEERELLQEYYEVFLETMEGEEGGGEE